MSEQNMTKEQLLAEVEHLRQRVRQLEDAASTTSPSSFEDLFGDLNRFRSILDSLPVLVSYVDATEHYRFNNQTYQTWFGHTPESVSGKHVREVLGEAAYDAIKPHLVAVLKAQLVVFESDIPYLDGGLRNICAFCVPHVNSAGVVLGFVALVQDVSQLHQAQSARAKSEAALARAQHIASLGNWEWDLLSQKLHWSDELYALFDISKETPLTFESIVARIHPDDRDKNQAFVDALLAGAQRYDLSFRLLMADGSIKHIYQLAEVQTDSNGDTCSVVGTMQDVTAMRQAQLALEEAQHIALVGSWDYDVKTDKPTWSTEMYRIFNIDPALGEPAWAQHKHRIHPDDWPALDNAVNSAVTKGEPFNIEFRIALPDGTEHWVWTKCVVHRDASGAVCRLSGTVQDISERRRAVAETTALLEATRAVVEKNEFLPLAKSIFTTCVQLIGAQAGYVALLSEDGDYNEVLFIDNGPLECTLAPDLPMLVRGLRGKASASGKAVYENAFATSDYARLLPEGHVRLDNVLFAPLLDQGKKTVGLLGMANKPGGFVERDAELAQAFGELIAIGLQRSTAEDARRASEAKYRQLFTELTVGFALHDIVVDAMGMPCDYRFVEVNPAFEQLTGLRAKDIVGKTLREVMPESENLWIERYGKVALTGVPVHFESYNRSLDKTYEVHAYQTQHGRFVVLFSDVTARALTQQALQQSETKFKTLFACSPDVVALTNKRGTIIDINFVGFGYQKEDVLGTDFTAYLDDKQKQVFWQAAERARSTGKAQGYHVLIRAPNGTDVHWHNRIAAINAAEGGFVINCTDVTAQNASEQKLRASEERFRSVFDSVTEGILLADAQTRRLLLANDSICEMLGYSVDELLQLRVDDIHPVDAIDEVAEAFDSQLRGQQKHAVELPMRRKDGSVFYADINAAPAHIDGKKVTVGCFRDITEKRNLHASMAQSDRLSSMGMLAAGIAHEINNPLLYVLFNLNSLAEEMPALVETIKELRRSVDKKHGADELEHLLGAGACCFQDSSLDDLSRRFNDTYSGADRIREIVRGLSTFSRVENDTFVPVQLDQVIDVAINMAFNEIKYRARLRKNYGKTPMVLASEGKLSQVFLNLLINAAHAIDSGNTDDNEIVVRTWADGDDVFAEVSDTGHGIATENIDRLFAPFFTTKEIGVGSGLGLSISKNIIESYGGRIEARNRESGGACFTIRVPAHKRVVEPVAEQVLARGEATDLSGRILIVDDEPAIHMVLSRLLRGHEIVLAGSGLQAKQILQADQAFDLIFCDIMMPQFSGLDLHAWLAEAYPELAAQLVFITGGAFTPKAREYLQKVDNAKLEKPFDAQTFLTVARERIKASKQRQNQR